MNLKKIINLALAVALVFALVGCGTQSEPSAVNTPTTIDTSEEESVATSNNYQESYDRIISQYKSNLKNDYALWSDTTVYSSQYDIDGNNTPELIFSTNKDFDSIIGLYTFNNETNKIVNLLADNVATKQESGNVYITTNGFDGNRISLLENSQLRYFHSTTDISERGYISFNYLKSNPYKLVKIQEIKQVFVSENTSEDGTIIDTFDYYIDSKNVNETKYNTAFKEFENANVLLPSANVVFSKVASV